MKKITINFIFCICLTLSNYSFAFDDKGEIESIVVNSEEQLLQGSVFDRTLTQTGLSFYQEFTRIWQPEPWASRYSITVKETPSARYGSIIWIEENNQLLYRVIIGVHGKKIQEKAKESLKQLKKKLGKKQFIIN